MMTAEAAIDSLLEGRVADEWAIWKVANQLRLPTSGVALFTLLLNSRSMGNRPASLVLSICPLAMVMGPTELHAFNVEPEIPIPFIA